jgi:hypothetical protein
LTIAILSSSPEHRRPFFLECRAALPRILRRKADRLQVTLVLDRHFGGNRVRGLEIALRRFGRDRSAAGYCIGDLARPRKQALARNDVANEAQAKAFSAGIGSPS